MQGWVPVGIKDGLMLCKHEPEESHRGMSDLGAALGESRDRGEEQGTHDARGLLSGLQNSLAGCPVW